MLERLEALLTQLATPAQKKLIIEACQALSAQNLWEHSTQVEDLILAANDTSDSGDLVFAIIEQVLIPNFRTYLQSMGLVLITDVTLEDCTTIFTALTQIETYEVPSAIHGLAAGDEENEDLLAEILALLTAQPAEYFITRFETVEDALMERIAEITVGQEPIQLPDPADYNHAKARVQRLVAALQAQDPKTFESLDLMSVRLGLNAETTLAAHREAIESMDDRLAAWYIVLHTYSTDVADAHLEAVASREVELIFEDLVRAMGVARQITKLIQQVGYA